MGFNIDGFAKSLIVYFSFGLRGILRHSTTIRTPRSSGFARLAKFIRLVKLFSLPSGSEFFGVQYATCMISSLKNQYAL